MTKPKLMKDVINTDKLLVKIITHLENGITKDKLKIEALKEGIETKEKVIALLEDLRLKEKLS